MRLCLVTAYFFQVVIGNFKKKNKSKYKTTPNCTSSGCGYIEVSFARRYFRPGDDNAYAWTCVCVCEDNMSVNFYVCK